MNLSIPFPIVYSAIERETEEDFVNAFCESLRSRLLLKNEFGIVSASAPCCGAISFVLKHGMPRVPEEGEGKTYVEEMDEWKRKITAL